MSKKILRSCLILPIFTLLLVACGKHTDQPTDNIWRSVPLKQNSLTLFDLSAESTNLGMIVTLKLEDQDQQLAYLDIIDHNLHPLESHTESQFVTGDAGVSGVFVISKTDSRTSYRILTPKVSGSSLIFIEKHSGELPKDFGKADQIALSEDIFIGLNRLESKIITYDIQSQVEQSLNTNEFSREDLNRNFSANKFIIDDQKKVYLIYNSLLTNAPFYPIDIYQISDVTITYEQRLEFKNHSPQAARFENDHFNFLSLCSSKMQRCKTELIQYNLNSKTIQSLDSKLEINKENHYLPIAIQGPISSHFFYKQKQNKIMSYIATPQTFDPSSLLFELSTENKLQFEIIDSSTHDLFIQYQVAEDLYENHLVSSQMSYTDISSHKIYSATFISPK